MIGSQHKHNVLNREILTAIKLLSLLLCLCAIFSLWGCDGKADNQQGNNNGSDSLSAKKINQTQDDGNIKVEITSDNALLTTADMLKIKFKVTLPENYELENPVDITPALPEDFKLVDTKHDTAYRRDSVGENRKIENYEFVIEPFLPGDYAIDRLEIGYYEKPNTDVGMDDNNTGTDDNEIVYNSLMTDAISVSIGSVLPDDTENVKPMDIKSVVEPDYIVPKSWLWIIVIAAGAGLGLFALSIYLIVRRHKRAAEIVLIRKTAHEIAYAELDSLVKQKLAEQGLFKTFYQGASGIMRHYIENRFGLHAPERTTEEFLTESSAADCFNGRDLGLFEKFLSHCDMVKFAELKPDSKQIDETLDTIRDFVDRTHIDVPQVVFTEDGKLMMVGNDNNSTDNNSSSRSNRRDRHMGGDN